MKWTIAWSSSSPPVRIDASQTMPERDDGDVGGAAPDIDHHVAGRRLYRETDPDGSGHGLRHLEELLDPADWAESRTARRSTSVMPEGTQTMTVSLTRRMGPVNDHRRKCRSIFSAM